MTHTASQVRNITLALTPAQVTQLLTAVHVRLLQAEGQLKNERFAQVDPINQANLRAQSQIAEELVAIVEQAIR